MEKTPNPKQILVTGSAGAIGQPISQYLLARGHAVRGFDLRPTAGLDDQIIGDLADKEKVYQAMQGMNTVVHLGAYPDEADFIDVLLSPNVVGLYHVCEAAKTFGVKRLILASSIQTVRGHAWPDRPLGVADGAKPTNHYALAKVWAETMGEMVAHTHNLSVISVRIGWYPRNRSEAERLVSAKHGRDVFFSHEDAKRFFACCVESPTPAPGKSVVLFATSKPKTTQRLDLETPRQIIGYEPRDVWPQGLPFSVDGLG